MYEVFSKSSFDHVGLVARSHVKLCEKQFPIFPQEQTPAERVEPDCTTT